MRLPKKLKPNIRFPEYTDDWKEVPLSAVSNRITRRNRDGHNANVLTNSATRGVVRQQDYFDKDIANEDNLENYYLVEKDDFVYNPRISASARVGPIKRNKLSAGVMSPIYTIFSVPHPNLEYFEQYFESPHWHSYIKKVGNVGARHDRMNVTVEDFFALPVMMPGDDEAQKITRFLSQVDAKIGQLTNKKKLLLKYKKGLMQQIFDQKIRFKNDYGKDFPVWKEKRFGEVFSFLPTNSFSRDDLNCTSGEVRNIHYGDIHTKFRPLLHTEAEEIPYINKEISLKRISKENYLRTGDLVFADASEDYADVGKCVEIGNIGAQRILAGLHTIHARPKPNTFAKGFGTYLMKSWSARWQIMREAQGTKVLGISTGRLAKIKLLLPSVEEQQKIAHLISTIETKVELVSKQLEVAINFKKGLLQHMFV